MYKFLRTAGFALLTTTALLLMLSGCGGSGGLGIPNSRSVSFTVVDANGIAVTDSNGVPITGTVHVDGMGVPQIGDESFNLLQVVSNSGKLPSGNAQVHINARSKENGSNYTEYGMADDLSSNGVLIITHPRVLTDVGTLQGQLDPKKITDMRLQIGG